MSALASPLDGLRSMLALDLMQHALLAGTGIAMAAGLVGYFVVLRNQVFTGDALSHVAFTGASAALAVGIDPLLGMVGGTVVVAAGMSALGGDARGRDVAVGTVVAWMLGLGVLFLALYTTARSGSGGAAGVTVLFGSVDGLTLRGAAVAAGVAATVCVAVIALARPLLFASVDGAVAAARGIPVRALGAVFLGLVAVTVAVSVQAVGALLIVGLLVTPAATAQRLTASPWRALWLSAGIGVGATWTGLVAAYATSKPPSFCIVAAATATYAVVLAGGRRRSRRGRRAT